MYTSADVFVFRFMICVYTIVQKRAARSVQLFDSIKQHLSNDPGLCTQFFSAGLLQSITNTLHSTVISSDGSIEQFEIVLSMLRYKVNSVRLQLIGGSYSC
jgi:hypothetical protein